MDPTPVTTMKKHRDLTAAFIFLLLPLKVIGAQTDPINESSRLMNDGRSDEALVYLEEWLEANTSSDEFPANCFCQ